LTKCIECGICKSVCPVYKILLRETVSPRGKIILKNKDVIDKIFYICTLCNNCERACPMHLKLKFKQYRAKLVANQVTTEVNQQLDENLRKHGTPFPKN